MNNQDNKGSTLKYHPTEDEPYMSDVMLTYYKHKLIEWRSQLLQDSIQGMRRVQEETPNSPEPSERASMETIRESDLSRLGQAENLLFQIDEALERITKGTYGYCALTGKPIGIERLKAWPIASLSAEAQAKSEKHLI